MPLKILVKFPTRNRPAQFLKVLRMMVEMSAKPEDIAYLVSTDSDDTSMNKDVELQAVQVTKNIVFKQFEITDDNRKSRTKVNAINLDMELVEGWDIVLLASDDMVPQVQGWDEAIRKAFGEESVNTVSTDKVWESEEPGFSATGKTTVTTEHNLDQALWFFDGHQHRICTLIVMGRKRYEYYNYLYHPSYISLWCDNEWTEVNQPKKFDTILFKHEHPAWGGAVPNDALYQRNEAYFERDRMNYEKRKQLNFPI